MDSRYVVAKAPVNIAVIKYWGKSNEELKIPLNDSLSGTLSIDDMCTTTSITLADDNKEDKLILNGKEELLTEASPATRMLRDVRSLVSDEQLLNLKAHIVTNNNFPTAAGLASSAAGYACLAYALGHIYGIHDSTHLSKIARKGSGSACRSMFGGFVQWVRGHTHEDSYAIQVADHKHWPEMRVIICVVSDSRKKVSSSTGMSQSVQTSSLIKYRAEEVVPKRITEIKQAILHKDFETFAKITMQDSNQFHAICLDTNPPITYLNETSLAIINMCHQINSFVGSTKVAYTFDAGPNACLYLLEDFVPTMIAIIGHFFPHSTDGEGTSIEIKGRVCKETPASSVVDPIIKHLESLISTKPDTIKYLINTSIGDGPHLVTSKRRDILKVD